MSSNSRCGCIKYINRAVPFDCLLGSSALDNATTTKAAKIRCLSSEFDFKNHRKHRPNTHIMCSRGIVTHEVWRRRRRHSEPNNWYVSFVWKEKLHFMVFCTLSTLSSSQGDAQRDSTERRTKEEDTKKKTKQTNKSITGMELIYIQQKRSVWSRLMSCVAAGYGCYCFCSRCNPFQATFSVCLVSGSLH